MYMYLISNLKFSVSNNCKLILILDKAYTRDWIKQQYVMNKMSLFHHSNNAWTLCAASVSSQTNSYMQYEPMVWPWCKLKGDFFLPNTQGNQPNRVLQMHPLHHLLKSESREFKHFQQPSNVIGSQYHQRSFTHSELREIQRTEKGVKFWTWGFFKPSPVASTSLDILNRR